MSSINTALHLIKKPGKFLCAFVQRFGSWLPESLYLKIIFRFEMGYRLNLKHPKTFSEKIQWLKLYNRKPEYTQMVDKYAVKDYVASIIGEAYIIPTLGVWDRVEDIEWDSLPDQFVLKTTHGGGGGGVVICKDKKTFNKQDAAKRLNISMKSDIYKLLKEWPYKNVPKRIIAEKYMEDESGELKDYKIFCFNNAVRLMFIASDRYNPNEDTKFDFFDENFIKMPFLQGHPNSTIRIQKPHKFEEMKQLAIKLSKDIPLLRIDFYVINGQIYFGELTFYHFSGLTRFEPQEWDFKIGEWLKLPKKSN